VFMTSLAALSMSLVVVSLELFRRVRRVLALLSVSVVVVSPSWQRSIRGFRMAKMMGGWFLVVGMYGRLCGGDGSGSPTWGIVTMTALWPMYVVLIGIIWEWAWTLSRVCVGRRRS
jgi:hypothetical protein